MAVANVWVVAVTIRRAAIPGILAPTTATIHTASATAGAGRIVTWTTAIILGIVPIVTPFMDISAHVIKPEFVGIFSSYIVGS